MGAEIVQLEQMFCLVRLWFRLLLRSRPFAFATCIFFEYAVITHTQRTQPFALGSDLVALLIRARIPLVRSFSPQ